ncbi:tetratricopeptide repeat protein [Leptospira sp. 201903070]|uniref:Tetratricopeptide repeat protein n=1 Tax=Leptospira ainlahdjerensis TaxID=2810033 RepID=A0ABS2UCR2_9LEPT|nr:tetratricopeptide repeat protein [Leptospira ainlahdjerensis]MBM9578159.1 tetratricopeptide repeat protein [Leptospira ainlahdjerensis]
MKKSAFIAIIGFLVILFFGLIVLDTKLFELKVILEKRKVLNFSFSSDILRSKFESILSNKENLRVEMNLNNLQSNLIESDQLHSFETNFWQNLGSALINAVRFVTGKPPIHFELNSSKIRALERAFRLERNQAYKDAYNAYEEALSSFPKGSEESGFILLHQGFCLAAQGELDAALQDLRKVPENNPGSSFANDAEILTGVILKSKENAKEIEANFESPEAKIRAYFAKGNYVKVLEEIAKIELHSSEMKYLRGYSLEKTGNQNEAITEYAKLAFSDKDKEIAIKANRRLLMLGHYYNAGSEIARISDKNAQRLGDVSEAAMIKSSAEKLKHTKEEDSSPYEESVASKEALKTPIQEIISDSEAFLKKAEEEAKAAEVRNYIMVHIAGAPPVYGERIVIEGDKTKLFSTHFPITLPTYTIQSITLDKKPMRTSKLKFVKDSKITHFQKAIFEDDQSITFIENKLQKKIDLNTPITIELSK